MKEQKSYDVAMELAYLARIKAIQDSLEKVCGALEYSPEDYKYWAQAQIEIAKKNIKELKYVRP